MLKKILWRAALGILSVIVLIGILDVVSALNDHINSEEREAVYRSELRRERIEKPCKDAGGIPIWSSWSNDLKECVFPPKR